MSECNSILYVECFYVILLMWYRSKDEQIRSGRGILCFVDMEKMQDGVC